MAKVIPTDFGIDDRDWLMKVGEREVRDWRWLWLRRKTVPVYEDQWRVVSVVSEKLYTGTRADD